ncbi:isopentenyl phosphate kinase [Haloferacaceae archaeon DSL9]
MSAPTVLKLGGSVITEKARRETVDDAALDAVCGAISTALEASHRDLVVVHGGGSFGHFNARDYGVSTREGTRDIDGVGAIHGAMKELNETVVERLRSRAVPAVPVHPLSVAARDADGTLRFPLAATATLLEEGFVPVLHGDVIAHRDAGVTVLSGDEIVTRVATELDADRVGLCSTVPGVLDEDARVIPAIASFDAVESVLGGSDATDVSGGMAAKVRELLALSAPAHIFGPDAVGAFLAGDDPGTRIDGA